MTQSDINNAVNTLVNSYTGKTEGYHGGYTGQCTVPVSYYVESLTGTIAPYMANDRADGWGTNFPEALAPYFTHESYQAGKIYPKGTILIWNSPHIAIVLSDNGGTTVEVFEQNADPDGSACHTATRVINTSTHTCTYALIPILTPDTPPAPYSIEQITPKEVYLTVNAYRQNCSVNPTTNEGIDPANTIFTAVGIIHHNNGNSYYMPNINDPSGFLVDDCADGTPPVSHYAAITPVTLQANTQPIWQWNLDKNGVSVNEYNKGTSLEFVGTATRIDTGLVYYMTAEDFGNAANSGQPVNNYGFNESDFSPVPIPPAPSLSTATPATVAPDTTPYTVVVALDAYGSAPKALTSTPPVTATLEPKNYYVFNQLNGMINLTDSIGVNKLWWINPTKNVVPPKVSLPPFNPPLPTPAPVVPTPPVVTAPVVNGWKSTYKAFNRENLPVKYTILEDIDVKDYSGVRPDALLDRGDDVWVFGTFTAPTGVVCGRLRSDKDTSFQYYFGVAMTDMRTKGKVLTAIDYVDLGFQRVMDVIRRKL